MTCKAVVALALGLASTVAAAPAAPKDTVDIGPSREKLRIFTDGKKHYVALIPFDYSGPMFFYGDGSSFYAQRAYGGGRSSEEGWSRSFWEPRVHSGAESMFQLRDKKYTLMCSTRTTVFSALSDADNEKMLASARFMRPRWKRQSYWLGRDAQERYYFLDRMREPEGNNEFRLFVGKKGELKLQKLTKIESGTRGDAFSVAGGQLRVVTSSATASFSQGKQKIAVTAVPIEDNHILVYSDLGVYAGEKLGTPCDDL